MYKSKLAPLDGAALQKNYLLKWKILELKFGVNYIIIKVAHFYEMIHVAIETSAIIIVEFVTQYIFSTWQSPRRQVILLLTRFIFFSSLFTAEF
jgi:hypothetical protein